MGKNLTDVLAGLRHNLDELAGLVPIWGTQQPDDVRRWILERGRDWALSGLRFHYGSWTLGRKNRFESGLGQLLDHVYELRLGNRAVASVVQPYRPDDDVSDVAPVLNDFAMRHRVSWRTDPALNIWWPGKTIALVFSRAPMPEPLALTSAEQALAMGEFERLAGAILRRPRRAG